MLSGRALVEYVRVSTQSFCRSSLFQTLPSMFPSGIFRPDWQPGSLQGCKRKKVFRICLRVQVVIVLLCVFQVVRVVNW